MNDIEELPNNLKLLREEAGLSREDLAKLVGVSAVQIHRFEKGSRGIAKKWQDKICLALNINPNDLYLPPDINLPRETLSIHGTVPGIVSALRESTIKKLNIKIKRPGCYAHQIQGEFLNKMVHHLDYVIVDPGQQDKQQLDGKLVVAHVGRRRLSGFLQLDKKGYVDTLESFSTDPMIPKSEELETGWTIEGEVVAFLPKDLV